MSSSFNRLLTYEEFHAPVSASVGIIYGFIDRQVVVGGTVVFIAPGVALTAKHVIQEILGRFGFKETDTAVNLDLYVTQIQSGATWYVGQTNSWVGSDMSILSIYNRNDDQKYAFNEALPLTVDPPNVGDEVTAIGFPGTQLQIPLNDSKETHLKFNFSPAVAVGRVTDVHHQYRDNTFLRFPCFCVDTEFTGGMSGGAVFNKHGQLCGLVCSGGTGELKTNSYATSLWPLSIIPVKIPPDTPSVKGVEIGKSIQFLELASLGFVNFQGFERIAFFKHDNGQTGIRRYHPNFN